MPMSADPYQQPCGKHPQPSVPKPKPEATFNVANMISFLRTRHPSNTPYWVSSVTGIPPGTIENWLSRRSGPDRDHLSVLMCVYGPRFLQAVLSEPPAWVDRAAQQTEAEELERTIADAQAKLAVIKA